MAGRAFQRSTERDETMNDPNPITGAPPAANGNGNGRTMRTAPDHLTWLQSAILSDQEAARRASKTAWRMDANGNPIELLPAPAGEDEARIRHPECFVGLPAAAPPAGAASTKPISPADYPSAANTGAADDQAAEWADNARGSLPAPVGEWAASAIEQCGRTKKNKKLIAGAPARRLLDRIGQSAEWAGLPPTDQAAVLSLLTDGAGLFPGMVRAALGSPGKPAPPLPVADADDEPDTLADLGDIEPARAVAAGVLFAGRLGLIHGPSGGGKTTALANVIARVTTGRPWLGQPTIPGAIVIACEELQTWGHAVKAAGGDMRRVFLRRWRKLPAAVEELRPVAVIVDTMQFIAHETGSAELDSAQAVDAILRPLERLCREYGCAVAVTDHEPWADPSAGASRDRESGTQKRPRHSGAKVATADYLLRISTADSVTTISRGAKVRWGIAIEPAVSVDVRGERVSAPAAPAGESHKIATGMDGTTVVTDTETYDRLIGFLTQHPNARKREIRDGLKMRGRSAGELDRAIDQAVAAGRIERRPGPRNSTLHRVVPRPEPYPPGTGSDPTPPEPVPVNGNMDGTTPGTGSDPIGNHSSGTGSAEPLAEPLAETDHAETNQSEHGTERGDPRCPNAVGGAQAGGELAGSTPGPADPRAGSAGPLDDSAQCDPTGGSGAARTIGAGPPDGPAGSADSTPPLPDLAALIIGWGERPTDASAAMRIGRFGEDEARRRGTLPESATAGAAAAQLLQTAARFGGVH